MAREGQQSFTKGRNIGEEFVHVPLVIVGPGIEPGRSRILVSAAIDLAATLVDLAGIAPPQSYDGVSLMPVLGGYHSEEQASSRGLYVRYYAWKGLLHGTHKLSSYKGALSLFDLQDDAHEKRNIADAHPALVKQLNEQLRRETKRIEGSYGG